LTNANAVKLDPIDNTIWVGQTTPFDLRHIALNGTAVLTETVVVPSFASSGSNAAIAFDANSNPIVAGGDVSTTGGVFRVDRNTSVVTPLVGAFSSIAAGTVNAMDYDPFTGDLYFGVTGSGARVYKLAAPGYATPTLVGTVSPP